MAWPRHNSRWCLGWRREQMRRRRHHPDDSSSYPHWLDLGHRHRLRHLQEEPVSNHRT